MLAQRNKSAIIALAFIQISLLAFYGAEVFPGTRPTNINTLHFIVTIVACVGFIYINHHEREFLKNAIGNWILLFILTLQVAFIFITLIVALDYIDTPLWIIMNGAVFNQCLPAVVMLTLVYSNLKAFLKLKDLIIVVMIGTLGFASNLVVCLEVRGMYDFGLGLSVYLFATFYYLFIRFIGLPVRIFSKSNKNIPITNNMALGGILVALIYFQMNNEGFVGDVNTLYCQFFAIIGYLILQLHKTNKVRLQIIFELTVGAGILMSVGGTLFQNFTAPCSIGMIYGMFNSMFGPKLKLKIDQNLRKIPDPSKLFNVFGFPAILASFVAFIGIAQYNSKSTNQMGSYFPYSQLLWDSISTAFQQLSLLPITIGMSIGTGLLAGLILKKTSDNNEIQSADLLFNEQQQQYSIIQQQEYQPEPQDYFAPRGPLPNKQTPVYIPPVINQQVIVVHKKKNGEVETYQNINVYPQFPIRQSDINDQIHEIHEERNQQQTYNQGQYNNQQGGNTYDQGGDNN